MAATRNLKRLLTQKTFIGILTPLIAITLALIVSGVIILLFIISYNITDETFTTLREKGVPADILQSLQPLRNKEYKTRQLLEDALFTHIASFQCTAPALERLQQEGVPAEILDQLRPLQTQGLATQSAFLKAVKERIGKDHLLAYREVLLKYTDQHRRLRATIVKAARIRENPVTVYKVVFQKALGDREGIGEVLYRATPLIFTGLAVAFAFQCGLFNIGGEGQMVIGGFATAWIGFTLSGFPGFLLIPLCILAGASAGAFWGAIPGYLKAKLGVHEVVNTIMMNWIAVALIQYLTKMYKEPGDMIPQTAEIADAAKLSRLHLYLNPIFEMMTEVLTFLAKVPGFSIPCRFLQGLFTPFPKHVHLNTSFLVALLVVALLAYLLKRTKAGYEIRAVGFNPTAAECAGISVAKNTMLAMAISGAVAGLVGVNQVMGDKYRFLYEIFDGKGFDGIGVALIGKNSPFGAVLGALLFGILEFGGFSASVQSGGRVPREIIMILKAIILIFVVISGEITKRAMVLLQKKKGGQA